jgi:hypothetical protein
MVRRQSIIFLAFIFALCLTGLARAAAYGAEVYLPLGERWLVFEGSTGLQVMKRDNQYVPVQSDHAKNIKEPTPGIDVIMSQVNSSTVAAYNGALSGEMPVIVAGQPYTIETRYTYSGRPIQAATKYVGQHLEDLGLSVEYHVWDGVTYPNVIGQLKGETYPEEIMMITAHLDSTSRKSMTDAPGADDNASGSTAVLIAADILSQYKWDCTLRFAFWTGEEQGLLGSMAYAERAFEENERIRGVLNLDMIAWNTAGSEPDIDLYSIPSIPGSVPLALTFSYVVSQHDLNLTPELMLYSTRSSDQSSFWERGFPAMLAIEDRGDFNPYYHSTGDRLSNMDINYFTEFVRAAVGTFSLMGDCGQFPQIPIIYLPVTAGEPALVPDR